MTGEDNNLEFIKKLKALGVKHAKVYSEAGGYHYVSDVEFFPPEPDRLERVKPDESDNRVNDATGLTRAESRELFGMDE